MSATWKSSKTTGSPPVPLNASLVSRKATLEHDNRITEVQVYEGDTAGLATLQPIIGASFASIIGANLVYVRSVEYETHSKGPVVRMTVTATNWTSGGNSESDTDYELEWMRVDKDIRSHRAFNDSGAAYEMDEADWNELAEWEAETNASKKQELYDDLSVSATALADRLKKGETNYPVWVPVARKSYQTITRPTTSSVGKIDTPPPQCGAPLNTEYGKAYFYVLMADRAVRQRGVWRRQQEWMGFDDIDLLLYMNK